jgi:DMSO/TMAO reductase YedYZ molybdopterin-dependent catalytic subunit
MGKADSAREAAGEPDRTAPPGGAQPHGGAPSSGDGSPVGRRIVLGMVGLGAVGVLVGARTQSAVDTALGPLNSSVGDIVPGAGGFRFYSVAGTVKPRTAAAYQLRVDGLVSRPSTLSMAALQALPRTRVVRDFQCVTGWRVPKVPWTGVALPDLLDHVGVDPRATVVRFHSFDGVYTEQLTLDQARRRDVLIAYAMRDAPVIHDHGGPVRLYVAPMYGYKSLKWLGRIQLSDRSVPGYWEGRGYDDDAWVGRSNGRSDAAT